MSYFDLSIQLRDEKDKLNVLRDELWNLNGEYMTANAQKRKLLLVEIVSTKRAYVVQLKRLMKLKKKARSMLLRIVKQPLIATSVRSSITASHGKWKCEPPRKRVCAVARARKRNSKYWSQSQRS